MSQFHLEPVPLQLVVTLQFLQRTLQLS